MGLSRFADCDGDSACKRPLPLYDTRATYGLDRDTCGEEGPEPTTAGREQVGEEAAGAQLPVREVRRTCWGGSRGAGPGPGEGEAAAANWPPPELGRLVVGEEWVASRPTWLSVALRTRSRAGEEDGATEVATNGPEVDAAGVVAVASMRDRICWPRRSWVVGGLG